MLGVLQRFSETEKMLRNDTRVKGFMRRKTKFGSVAGARHRNIDRGQSLMSYMATLLYMSNRDVLHRLHEYRKGRIAATCHSVVSAQS